MATKLKLKNRYCFEFFLFGTNHFEVFTGWYVKSIRWKTEGWDYKQKRNYFRYGTVMFFNKDGFRSTSSLHSSRSIFPSPFKSASSNVYGVSKQKMYSVDTWLGGLHVAPSCMPYLINNGFHNVIREDQVWLLQKRQNHLFHLQTLLQLNAWIWNKL